MMSIRFSPLRAAMVALCAVALTTTGLVGCGAKSGSGKATGGTGAAATGAGTGKDLAIGFIYVGPRDDYGYNQAHADGAAAVKKMPGVTVTEAENVPETIDVQKTMKSMIAQDGATLVFPTSFGYFSPHVLEMAKKYPDIMFLHCGGLYDKTKHPKNVGSYFGYIDECQYISGIVAAHATQSKKLGFVAAKPIPQVRRNINAFTLGARSVDPKVTVSVIFTGDWSMPQKEAEATNQLIDQGVDVITCHVDSPKVVVETAERRGAKICGYHASQAPIAPKGYLTGAEWNWGKVYTDYVKMVQEGKKPGEIPNLVRGGIKEGIVKMSPYTSLVTPEARKAADAAKEKLMTGTFSIFKGPLKDNTGKTVIPEGTAYPQTAIELESMDYLVEGTKGS
jgi:simple sugar transport system substrate-binding protein